MIPMTLRGDRGRASAAPWTATRATEVTGAAFLDSRSPVPGGLFVAVAGERVDGHDYAERAAPGPGPPPCWAPAPPGSRRSLVEDPVAALGRLARHVLDSLDVTVLALTGSQGKTGTKDYLGPGAGHRRRRPSPRPATSTTSSACR